MARNPSVRSVNGYWYSQAGGKGRYFGRVDQVSREEALSLLWKALAEAEGKDRRGKEEPGECSGAWNGMEDKSKLEHLPSIPFQIPEAKASFPNPSPSLLSPQEPITIDQLSERFLSWVQANREAKAHKERSRHLSRFRKRYGKLPAIGITGTHIEEFTEWLQAQGHAPDYVQKHLVSVGAMFNRSIRKGWIPATVKPFASVEPIRLPPKALKEEDLPTAQEIKALLQSADADAHKQMSDIIRLYYATGARTHELIEARCGDYQPNARTIVLAKHKRSHTLREPKPRTIVLNGEAQEIVERRIQGRPPESPIFTRPSDGRPYINVTIAERFQNVRKRAGVRAQITLYSFRHLWISEALMSGLDSMLVAKMSGTSVKMIECVYGHFKTSSFREAQARLDACRKINN